MARAFGVILARWNIIQRPSRIWFRDDISNVMLACIIMHNMVVEYRRYSYCSQLRASNLNNDALALFRIDTTLTSESKIAKAYRFGHDIP